MITISNDRWDKIHELFSKGEKALLRNATVGQTVCPPRMTVDETILPAELADKLRSHA